MTSKEAKMGKVMRHTLGASLNIRHNLSSSKGPKPLQLKLLTTYIPKTSAFTLAFSTSQRLRTTRASARTFFTFRLGIQSATSRQNTKDQVYAQNEMLAYQQKESTARVASIMENTNLSKQQQVSEIMRQMLTQAQTA